MATTTSQHVPVGGGRIAYDDTGGTGRVVLCIPGAGDVRGAVRFLAPKLVEAGYRVVTMDVRGHGESSADWPSYTQTDIAGDMLAVLNHLDVRDAVLVGGSISGGSVLWAAAEAPDRVGAVVGIGPARDPELSPFTRALAWLVMRSPRLWDRYYASLYKAVKPADLKSYRRALLANLRQPGRYAATGAMLFGPKSGVRARFAEIHCPSLVVMGTKDPDFPAPSAEATELATALHGEVELVPGAGHYPQVEFPDRTAEAILTLLKQ